MEILLAGLNSKQREIKSKHSGSMSLKNYFLFAFFVRETTSKTYLPALVFRD